MESGFRIALPLLLLLLHLPFAWRFLAQLQSRLLPSPVYFAAMGIILYYDLGFLLQTFGWQYQSLFFPELALLSIEAIAAIAVAIGLAPYLLYFGYRAVTRDDPSSPAESRVALARPLQPIFQWVFFLVSMLLAVQGISLVWGVSTVVDVKREWLEQFGRAYIIFFVPLFVLAFFCRTQSAEGRRGALKCFFLLVCAVGGTLFLGQRTLTLLPILILALFRFRFSAVRAAALVVILIAISAAGLWFYKGEVLSPSADLGEQLTTVVNNDLIRVNVLARAMADAEMLGTRALPAPGSGYLFTALLYVPRSLVPDKGYSTAAYFTSFTNGDDLNFIKWGLGIGFLEEIVLNFGWLALFPGVILYGCLLGLLARVGQRWQTATVGIHLAPVLMSGYGSSSVLVYFGPMVLFAIILEELFVAAAPAPRRYIVHAPLNTLPVGLALAEGSHSAKELV